MSRPVESQADIERMLYVKELLFMAIEDNGFHVPKKSAPLANQEWLMLCRDSDCFLLKMEQVRLLFCRY